ncbi:DinB family protein [Pedobacter sandarakinus]|uniref:DinB family protein n=1 Tax=Pedobacter sandarakinus TaxID=353156 RepID=UPI00224668D3|nr:DinB family protein [Pedobacter sandarakinus]MCX2575283.1 DinB family protein [Pedobacter sandarakinus]
MNNDPQSHRMYGILVLFDMQTDFLLKALDGISQEDAQKRLNTQANHIAWITGSIVAGRYYLADQLGISKSSVTDDLFKDNRGLIEDATYPTLSALKADWLEITPPLKEALTAADEQTLNQLVKMPNMEFPLFDMITFTCYREANCIGQIALWRRLLNYQAMKYM